MVVLQFLARTVGDLEVAAHFFAMSLVLLIRRESMPTEPKWQCRGPTLAQLDEI